MRKLALTVVLGLAFAAALGEPSASANSADPSCNGGSCTPWFKVDVNLSWAFDPDPPTAADPGCDNQTVSAEGDNAVTCTVTWDPDPPSPFNVHVKIDKTDPTVTGANPSISPNGAGWFSAPVTFQFTGTDALSGLDSCQSVGYSGPDDSTANVNGTCTDVAGNTSAPTGHAFKYDNSNPAVTGGSPTRTADHGTWWNHPVTVQLTGSDATSGIASCTAPTYSGPDDGTANASGSCTDNAGNVGNGSSSTFKYDGSAPSVTGGAPTRGADHAGWYNHAVTVQLTGSDATSGIESCDALGYSGPDTASTTVSGSCTNNAGLSASGNSASFKYDATNPVTSLNSSRAADSGIWFNHPVNFTWSATDATSGPDNASCTSITNFNTQTASQVLNGSCDDNAGNTSSASTTVHYDSVAPTTSVTPSRSADHGIWYVRPVTFHTSATDATSGVNAASCTGDNVFSTQTASQSVTGSCSDNAGNSDSGSTTVHYDSVAPSVSVSASRPPDVGPWYNHAVTLHWSGADATSGLDSSSCTADNVFGTQGAGQVVTGSCSDNAGLKTTATRSLNFDSVVPTGVTGTPDRAPDAGGWYNHPLNVAFTGADSVSGIASCSTVAFSGPNTSSSGTTVSGSCTDNAGNSTAPTASQNIKYDSTPPTNNGGVLQRATPDKDGWYNHALPIQFSGTPNGPSGLAGCDTLNYTGPDGANVKGTGNCTSVSGVTTAAQSPAFNFDATPPAVSVTADRPADHNGWYTHPVTFTVHGADTASGVTNCGGGGTYSGPDTSFGGIVGGCDDLAGNTGFGSAGFKYDATPPGTPTVAALPGKRQVKVSWTIPRDASSVVVTRSQQGPSAGPQVVYSGNHTSVIDKKVKDGIKYRYTVSALDQASNQTAQSIVAVPTTSSLRPFAETLVSGPPRLSWKKIKPARYYNVQLWRDGAKVLSIWPRKPFLQLKQAWTFSGAQYSFVPGHYKWYVWPGFGQLSRHRYGHLIGQSTFAFGVPL
jgi:hypothetical protein